MIRFVAHVRHPALVAVDLVGDDPEQVDQEAHAELLFLGEKRLDLLGRQLPDFGAGLDARARRAGQPGERPELADQRRWPEPEHVVARPVEHDLALGEQVDRGRRFLDLEQRALRVDVHACEQLADLAQLFVGESPEQRDCAQLASAWTHAPTIAQPAGNRPAWRHGSRYRFAVRPWVLLALCACHRAPAPPARRDAAPASAVAPRRPRAAALPHAETYPTLGAALRAILPADARVIGFGELHARTDRAGTDLVAGPVHGRRPARDRRPAVRPRDRDLGRRPALRLRRARGDGPGRDRGEAPGGDVVGDRPARRGRARRRHPAARDADHLRRLRADRPGGQGRRYRGDADAHHARARPDRDRGDRAPRRRGEAPA